MTVVRCYQKCCLRGEDSICTRAQITLDTRGACLYREPETKEESRSAKTVDIAGEV